MTDYHTVYKGPEGQTTQWEDIQRKLGNLPAKEPVWKPDAFKPEEDEVKDAGYIDKKDADELSDMEDEFGDDRFLEQYRQQRIAELRQAASKPRFGSLEQIRGSEFVKEVSQAGHDIWVVVLLFKEGVSECGLLGQCLEELAERFPFTKFVKAVSTDCIPNYPDRNLPTVLVYNNSACKQHLVGLSLFGGRHVTPEQVALTLNQYGPICGADDEDTQHQHIRDLVKRVIQKKEDEDEDSDFD